MPPPSFLPRIQPLPMGSGQDVAAQTLGAVQQLTRDASRFQPATVCLSDGRLFLGYTVVEGMLEPSTLPARTAVVGAQRPGLSGNVYSEAMALSDRMAGSFQVIAEENGFEVEALGQFMGFSSAIPFRIHWLPDSQRWFCVGGFFTQPKREADPELNRPEVPEKQVRVEHSKLSGDAGLIGLRMKLDTNRWSVKFAEWQFVGPTVSSESQMPDSVFVPLYSVIVDPPKAYDLGWQQPDDSGTWKPFLVPFGISGNILEGIGS